MIAGRATPKKSDHPVERSWRSWPSNLLLSVVFGGLAAIAAGVAVTEAVVPVAVGFGVGAALCAVLAIRSLALSVAATENGFRARELFRTRHVSWAEVADIYLDGQESGLAGLLGAVSPIVRLSGQQTPAETDDPDDSMLVELRVLGSYPTR